MAVTVVTAVIAIMAIIAVIAVTVPIIYFASLRKVSSLQDCLTLSLQKKVARSLSMSG
jgi:hypothetical protein